MGQLTQTTAQVQVILDDADAANVGKTSLTDSTDTTAVAVRKSGFYSLGASSSNAPSTDRAILISAVRDTTATGEIRYGQVAITESNGMWWNRDDGGTLGTWYEAVSTAGTQTLTNKTLTSPVLTTPQINDTSANHQYVFAVSELAADRTVTMPLLTGNDTFVFEAHTQTLTNKTLTSPVLNTSVSGSAVLDEDDMSSNSATQLATQQSIKAYVDSQVTAQDLDFAGDSGTGAVDLDSQTFTIAGTTNEIETSASGQTLTVGLPSAVAITTSLNIASSTTVDGVLDEDNMATNSATKLATQQSIKAYVDAQVATSDTLAEVLANGNTSGGTGLTMSSGDDLTLTGASYNAVWDSSDSALEFADNAKAIFGAGSDLQIYHDGSNSYIKDAGTGDLYIQGEANVRITDGDGNKMFLGQNDGEVQLYHNGTEKFHTQSTGVNVIGTVTVSSSTPTLQFTDTDNNYDATIQGLSGSLVLTADSGAEFGTESIQFKTGATERVRIDASGKVGIGTSSPSFGLSVESDNGSGYAALFRKSSSDPALTIQTTSSITQLQGLNSALNATNDIAMQLSGSNVGIGTSSPSAKLTLNDSGQQVGIDFKEAGTTRAHIEYDGTIPALELGTNGAANVVLKTSNTERMRIDSSGNVGIGTASPTAGVKLHVVNASQVNQYLESTGNATNSILQTGADGNSAYVFNRANAALTFGTNNTERLRIDSSGNVGIGTTSPTFGSGSGLEVSRSGTATVRVERTGSTATSGEFFAGNDKVAIGSTSNTHLELRTNSTERMRIDSSGNVTVKASGVDQARTLSLQGTNGASETYQFNLVADGENAAAKFMVGVGGGAASERMRIDSSGNVKIADGDLEFSATQSNYSINVPDTASSIYNVGDRGNITIKASSSTSGPQASSGGRVLITAGNSNNGQTGDIVLSTGVNIVNSADKGTIRFNIGGTASGDEAARLDASGNLLVGTTDSSLYNNTTGEGVAIHDDHIQIARSGNSPLSLNRQTSDGVIIDLRKAGSTVGSIGTDVTGNAELYIQGGNANDHSLWLRGGDCGIRLDGTANAIIPTEETSGGEDDKVSLGNSTYRFKDLYLSGNINGISAAKSASGNRWGILPEVDSSGVLEIGRYLDFHSTDGDTSDYGARFDFDGTNLICTAPIRANGGVYIGGTGSANHLDDYEEGTWTATSAVTLTANTTPKYTKIGRLVHLVFDLTVATTSSSSDFLINLPFAGITSQYGTGTINYNSSGSALGPINIDGNVGIKIRNVNQSANLLFSNLSGVRIIGSVTYETSA